MLLYHAKASTCQTSYATFFSIFILLSQPTRKTTIAPLPLVLQFLAAHDRIYYSNLIKRENYMNSHQNVEVELDKYI